MALQFPGNTGGGAALAGGGAPVGPQTITQMGAQQAAAGVAQQAAAVQQATRAATQDAQAALEEQQEADKARVFGMRQAISKQARGLADALEKQGASAQAELFDGNLRFERDELDRTLFNERQLADYAASSAKTQEQLLAYEQQVAQTLERKQSMLRQALAVITQAEQQAFEREQQGLNQEQLKRIALAKKRLQDDIARMQADAANTAAIWNGVTMVGGALATVFPPAGLAVAGVGAVGGAVSASDSNEQIAARRKEGGGL